MSYDDTTDKIDALGNDLVLGNLYGYSYSKSGFTTTVIGRLEKINARRATIRILKRREFLYGQVSDHELRRDYIRSETSNVTPCMLFPLAESNAE